MENYGSFVDLFTVMLISNDLNLFLHRSQLWGWQSALELIKLRRTDFYTRGFQLNREIMVLLKHRVGRKTGRAGTEIIDLQIGAIYCY